MIYYTADLHFHYALLLPSRPFATVEEMDEALVKNWNDTVGPEDTSWCPFSKSALSLSIVPVNDFLHR